MNTTKPEKADSFLLIRYNLMVSFYTEGQLQSSCYHLSMSKVNQHDSKKPIITLFLVMVSYHESDPKFLSYNIAV